jgi:hypothetical protein
MVKKNSRIGLDDKEIVQALNILQENLIHKSFIYKA